VARVSTRNVSHRSRAGLTAAAVSAVAVGAALALHLVATAVPEEDRFEATFAETRASVLDHTADLGVVQLVRTGTGEVAGRGAATAVVAIAQDRSVRPCGPGSWTGAAIRRIVLVGGVLVVRESSLACGTASGTVISGVYEVDGRSSTGIFANAQGRGELVATPATDRSHLSGTLQLAEQAHARRRAGVPQAKEARR
jgi:hypothetical protein